MDYQQYQAYQPMGYQSYHYQYATPANHLKVRVNRSNKKAIGMELFCRRLVSAQVLSCCVYEMPKTIETVQECQYLIFLDNWADVSLHLLLLKCSVQQIQQKAWSQNSKKLSSKTTKLFASTYIDHILLLNISNYLL